jgi:hypothetical protein
MGLLIYITYSYSQPEKYIDNVPSDYCIIIVWYGTSHSKLASVLLRQKKWHVLDIAGSFSAWVLRWRTRCAKRNVVCPIRAASCVSIAIYPNCTIIVSLQKQMVWHLFQLQLQNGFIDLFKYIDNVPSDYCIIIVWYGTSHSKLASVLFHYWFHVLVGLVLFILSKYITYERTETRTTWNSAGHQYT